MIRRIARCSYVICVFNSIAIGVGGCTTANYESAEPRAPSSNDSVSYADAEPGEGVHIIEVFRDGVNLSSTAARIQVQKDWNKRANELCPDGLKSAEFKFVNPGEAYFEEIRCDSSSCSDRVVGQGYAECKQSSAATR